jgi:hypothetical protein
MAQGPSCSDCADHETELTEIQQGGMSVPGLAFWCRRKDSPYADGRVEGPEALRCGCFRLADAPETQPY